MRSQIRDFFSMMLIITKTRLTQEFVRLLLSCSTRLVGVYQIAFIGYHIVIRLIQIH